MRLDRPREMGPGGDGHTVWLRLADGGGQHGCGQEAPPHSAAGSLRAGRPRVEATRVREGQVGDRAARLKGVTARPPFLTVTNPHFFGNQPPP
ncbi:protein of unknown function [Methylocaldum szegediense]|uniref:Uncharacterized protein n=1 Tax=Methylocaldum szegediense TaxID=73780 RepID=A0ABN8X8Z8_9GAMM|nr:protein of unknown function [Methylocaldum szegediense]